MTKTVESLILILCLIQRYFPSNDNEKTIINAIFNSINDYKTITECRRNGNFTYGRVVTFYNNKVNNEKRYRTIFKHLAQFQAFICSQYKTLDLIKFTCFNCSKVWWKHKIFRSEHSFNSTCDITFCFINFTNGNW